MKAFEKNIRKVEPYVPGEQPGRKVIKLNTNENPYPPAPGVQKAMEQISPDKLRMYPDPTASVLVDSLAEYYGVNKDQVFVGVGSDDVLSMCFLTFFNSEKPILFPDITYSFYKVWADLYRIPYICPKLTDDFRIRKEDYYQENGGVIFPNPNAPTGIYEDLEFVEDIIAHNQDVIVIVDEAYIDFAGKSALELIDKYENLIVVQTFSKSRSLAGARVGFAIANPELIADMNRIKYSFNPYNVNRLSILAGAAAMRDWDYTKECTGRICKTREKTTEALRALGFTVLDSKTNFIFAKSGDMPGKVYFDGLREAGILVRRWDSERIKDYVRISIGSEEEMETFVEETKKLVEAARSAVVR